MLIIHSWLPPLFVSIIFRDSILFDFSKCYLWMCLWESNPLINTKLLAMYYPPHISTKISSPHILLWYIHLLLIIRWLNLIQSTVYYFNSLQLLRIPYTYCFIQTDCKTYGFISDVYYISVNVKLHILYIFELITEYTVNLVTLDSRIYSWGLCQTYLIHEHRQMYSTLVLPLTLVYYPIST